MQKKLIALAVAAITSGAAFAQTNVVISGNMDLSIATARVQTAGNVNTTTNTMGAANSSTTSNVALTVTEDLGNGLRVKAYIETDPVFGTNSAATGFSNAPNWLELSGNFGALSMGYINNFALTTSSTSQPFGTAMASGYSAAFGRLDGATNAAIATTGTYTVATLGGAGARDVRQNNTLQYVTPNFAGFSGGLQYGAKNNAAASAPGLVQLGLNYANGPIKVSYTNSQITGDGAAVGLGTLAGNKVTHNLLGANFTMGLATIYGGWTSSRNTNNTIDSRSWNLALKYAFTGALSGAVNVLKVNDMLGGDRDRTLAGFGLDYAMSKRTTAYMRYEGGDNDRAAILGANTGNFNRAAVGMRHSF